MSALGHKRTCALQKAMSALPPIADMCSAQAMSAKCQKRTLTHDYSITVEAEHLRGFQVDVQSVAPSPSLA